MTRRTMKVPMISPEPTDTADPRCGFVLATTGDEYRRLAAKTARSIRQHCPGYPIHLFTDVPPAEDCFDQVHILSTKGTRPRFEALLNIPFERSIILDVDLMLVAPIDDIFDVLQRFDLALAQDQFRNTPACHLTWRSDIPAAFPQFNSGVFGFRRSSRTLDFVRQWEAAFIDHGSGVDQPSFRELLWNNTHLRVATLPEEYNLRDIVRIDRMVDFHCAPRVIHSHMFKIGPVLASENGEVKWVLGGPRMARMQRLIDSDAYLTPGRDRSRPHRVTGKVRPGDKLMHVWLTLLDLPRKVGFAWRRLRDKGRRNQANRRSHKA